MASNPIRSSIQPLLNNPDHVTINIPEVDVFASKHATDSYELPQWDAPVFPDQDAAVETVVDYLFVGNTLNFHFNNIETGEKFATEYLDTEWRGAYGMWACMKRARENGVDLTDAYTLATLDSEIAREIFTPSNGVEIPLFDTRLEMLRQTGDVLLTEYNGSFLTLVEDADGWLFNNGTGMLEQLVSKFPAYRDEWEFQGQPVRFDKRAQLAIAMAYDWYVDTNQFPVKDLQEMTIFADYGVPTVLRANDLISYTEDLSNAVDSGEHILAGSQEELEIRAATVAVGDLLLGKINSQREGQELSRVEIPHLDYKLWAMRNDAGPTHLTETTAY